MFSLIAPDPLHHVPEFLHEDPLRPEGVFVVNLVVMFVGQEILDERLGIDQALDPTIHEAGIPQVV